MAYTTHKPSRYYYVIAVHSCMPLGVSGIRLRQRDPKVAKPEEIRFVFYPAGPNVFMSPARQDSLRHCFSVDGGSQDDKAGLGVVPHEKDASHMRFHLLPDGRGAYRIMAAHSHKYLDVYLASKADRAEVVQHRPMGGDNQLFVLVPAELDPGVFMPPPASLLHKRPKDLKPMLELMARNTNTDSVLALLQTMMKDHTINARTCWSYLDNLNVPHFSGGENYLAEAVGRIPVMHTAWKADKDLGPVIRFLDEWKTVDLDYGNAVPHAIDVGTICVVLSYVLYLEGDNLPNLDPRGNQYPSRDYYRICLEECIGRYARTFVGRYQNYDGVIGQEARKKDEPMQAVTKEERVPSEKYEEEKWRRTSEAFDRWYPFDPDYPDANIIWSQTWEYNIMKHWIKDTYSGYEDHMARADFAKKQRHAHMNARFDSMADERAMIPRTWNAFLREGNPNPVTRRSAITMGIYGGMYGHNRFECAMDGLRELTLYCWKDQRLTGMGMLYAGQDKETLYGQKGNHAMKLILAPGEHITGAYGFGKDIIDYLCLTTDTGRIVYGGSPLGRDLAYGFCADLSDGLDARLTRLTGHHKDDRIEQLSFTWEYETEHF